MPRYIGYEFTGTANSSVTKFSGFSAGTSDVVAYVNYDGNTRTVLYSTGASAATYNGTAGSLTTSQTKDGTHSLDPAPGEYLTLASALGTTGTIEAFFYNSSLPGSNERLFGIGSHSETNQFQCFMTSGGNITLRQGAAGDAFSTPSSFTTGQWNHIAYSWSGGTGQFYVDGTRISNFSQIGTYSSTRVSIGNIDNLSNPYIWSGFIDCVRISTVARYSGTSISVPDPNDLLPSAQPIYTVEKKYNSGIWNISGTDINSVYGRRREGNWLTTLRNNPAPQGPIPAEILVVAGGGAGGGDPGYYKGGGGAGGYRAFPNVSILPGTNYTVVVGAGGSAPSVTSGSPSSLSGPNLPAPSYTSAGGGHGNQVPWPAGGPGAGGSGGGLPGYQPSPQKAGNTPPTSPPQGNPGGVGSGYGAGAGGGAGGAGDDGSGNGLGGNGGPGLTWPHSGSTYAGGGGGGNGQGDPGSFGAGGPGGGGRGSGGGGGSGGQSADPGTTNTGGGGGGRTRPGQTAGSGGSGVVIVAVAPSDAPRLSGGTPSTAPTPAGGKTLFTFTSPGTLTVT